MRQNISHYDKKIQKKQAEAGVIVGTQMQLAEAQAGVPKGGAPKAQARHRDKDSPGR